MEYNNIYSGLAIAGGILLVIVIIRGLVSLTMKILDFIGRWRIHEKAGQPGWYCFIPVFNDYKMYELATGTGWPGALCFFLRVVRSAASLRVAMSVYNAFRESGALPEQTGFGFSTVLGLVLFGFNIYLAFKLSTAFDCGAGMAMGLMAFPRLFRFILGVGKNTYVGYGAPKESRRATGENEWTRYDSAQNDDVYRGSTIPRCRYCQEPVVHNAPFCPKCGRPY